MSGRFNRRLAEDLFVRLLLTETTTKIWRHEPHDDDGHVEMRENQIFWLEDEDSVKDYAEAAVRAAVIFEDVLEELKTGANLDA